MVPSLCQGISQEPRFEPMGYVFYQGHIAREIPILQDWRGDYPVSELGRLPAEQRRSAVGYLDSMDQFAEVWQAFKPGEKIPEVDFCDQLVLFARNVVFFNRVGMAQVLLKNTTAEVLVMESMSALPIEDKVGMALAVISGTGVNYISAGNALIPVPRGGHGLASDPINATYKIGGRKIAL